MKPWLQWGLEMDLRSRVGSEIENSQQTVFRPKAKAKQSGMGSKDGPSAAEDFGYTLVMSEGQAPAAMTDASKRLMMLWMMVWEMQEPPMWMCLLRSHLHL